MDLIKNPLLFGMEDDVMEIQHSLMAQNRKIEMLVRRSNTQKETIDSLVKETAISKKENFELKKRLKIQIICTAQEEYITLSVIITQIQ
jgi:regulator of replication initiation timing